MKTARARKTLETGVLTHDIGYRVAQAQVTTTRVYVKHIGEPLALRPVEYSVLMLLVANQELSPKQLAQALSLSAPTLTMLVDRLHERGLIERVRSEADKRSQRVLLTAAGQHLAQQAVAASPVMNREFDQVLTPGEQMLLSELLQKVADFGHHRE